MRFLLACMILLSCLFVFAAAGCNGTAASPTDAMECGPEGCPIPGADGKVAPPPPAAPRN